MYKILYSVWIILWSLRKIVYPLLFSKSCRNKSQILRICLCVSLVLRKYSISSSSLQMGAYRNFSNILMWTYKNTLYLFGLILGPLLLKHPFDYTSFFRFFYPSIHQSSSQKQNGFVDLLVFSWFLTGWDIFVKELLNQRVSILWYNTLDSSYSVRKLIWLLTISSSIW